MPNSLFAGSFQNYDFMLTVFAIELQLKVEPSILRHLPVRVFELSKLQQVPAGAVVLN